VSEAVIKSVSCPPLGDHILRCEVDEDTAEDTEFVVELVTSNWSILWPKLKSHVSDLLSSCDRQDYFRTSDFRMTIEKSGGWVDDDFFIELKFDDADGFWCVFFKDLEVIHAQPSF
jgi:hypothetical protein